MPRAFRPEHSTMPPKSATQPQEVGLVAAAVTRALINDQTFGDFIKDNAKRGVERTTF